MGYRDFIWSFEPLAHFGAYPWRPLQAHPKGTFPSPTKGGGVRASESPSLRGFGGVGGF